jgi:heme/copper-type cytochrome/quinol oxidase subunit 3
MGAAGRTAQDLPAWVWAGFPPLMLALLVVAALVAPEWIPAITRSDHDPAGTGLAEHATVIVLLPGIAAGFAAFAARAKLPDRRLGWWILMWTLACVYFAGEEMS